MGTINIYSATHVFAYADFPTYMIFRHVWFTLIGLLIAYLITRFPIQLLWTISGYLVFYTLMALFLEHIPSVSHSAGGASRWLKIGSIYLMPSYFAQFSCVMYLSKILSETENIARKWSRLIIRLIPIILSFIMILAEPNLSEAIILFLVIFSMINISNARKLIYYFGPFFIIIFIAITINLLTPSYRAARMTTFLNPARDPHGMGYQIIQSYIFMGSGGLFGQGFDKGIGKYGYVPGIGTDFAMVNYIEEYGLVGFLIFISLLMILIFRIIHIIRHNSITYQKMLVFGFSGLILWKIVINLGTIFGLLPMTSIALPFFSYGGSSQIVNLASIGVILLISRDTIANRDYVPLLLHKLETSLNSFNRWMDSLKKHPIMVFFLFIISLILFFLKWFLEIFKLRGMK